MKVEFDFVPVMEAITDTIMQAHQRTEEHQIQQMRKYFAEDGTALSQPVNVKKDDAIQTFDVPLLSLVPPTAVQMKEVSVHLKVPVIKLIEEGTEERANGTEKIDKDYMADLHITYEGIGAPAAFEKISELLTESIK